MKLNKMIDRKIEKHFLRNIDLFRLDMNDRFLINSEIMRFKNATIRLLEYVQILKCRGKLFILESLLTNRREMSYLKDLKSLKYKSKVKVYGKCSCCNIFPITIEGTNECTNCIKFSHDTVFNPYVQSLDRETIKSRSNQNNYYKDLTFEEKMVLADKLIKKGKVPLVI